MKPFDDLTPCGKARRLRRVALSALAHYDLDVARVELLGLFTNTLFRVRTHDDPSGAPRSYVIRLSAPGWRTDEDLQRVPIRFPRRNRRVYRFVTVSF